MAVRVPYASRLHQEDEAIGSGHACENLSEQDTRLIVVKPAINMTTIMGRELQGHQLRTCSVPGSPSKLMGSKVPLFNCDATASKLQGVHDS